MAQDHDHGAHEEHRHRGHTQGHGHGHGHTHDNIDWSERIPDLRQLDALHAATFAEIAQRLTHDLPDGATVVDAGSGAGGMSAALAAALRRRGGGRLVLVDAVPELLAVAAEAAGATAEAVFARGRAPVRGGGARPVAGGADEAPRDGGDVPVAVGDDRTSRTGGASAMVVGDAAQHGASAHEVAGGAVVVGDAARTDGGEAAAGTAGSRAGVVEICTVLADVADDHLPSLVPAAQLVWAARMVHHLPDQQAGIAGLARVLAPGGVLAIAEGGLETECLPWDLGIGKPGFERRLLAARDAWFIEMRASIAGAVRMPYGWTAALRRAGLVDVGSFSRLIDHPAPPTNAVRDFVLTRITQLVETVGERLGDEDSAVASRLLDPNDQHYLGHRDDLFMLGTRTVHYGRKP